MPETVLSLRTYQLDPPFLWLPVYVRDHVVAWARDFLIAQLATNHRLFSELPDDCSGDIMEFLMLRMTWNELLDSPVQCSSPEARLFAIVVSAVAKEYAVRAFASLQHTAKCRLSRRRDSFRFTIQFIVFLSLTTQAEKVFELVPAAERGDLAAVQDCLAKGVDVDFRSPEVLCYTCFATYSVPKFHM